MNSIDRIKKYKIVAIARRVPVSEIIHTAEALYEGGIRLLEITFDQSSSKCISDTVKSIESVRNALGDKMSIGAGTVVTKEQAQAAHSAGAEFCLAPDVNPSVIEEVKKAGLISIPGAFTPSEILSAWNSGADIVKLFPAGTLGLPYFKAVRGPISHVPLMAVGGISESNFLDYLNAGFCSCGIGSNIVRNDLIEKGQFDSITRLAMEYTSRIKEL